MNPEVALFHCLVRKELRELFLGRALYAMFLVLAALTGASFLQALNLYGEASRAAANAPELARNLSPFDGVMVPTFGATYLVTTLLWPFVVIRQLGGDIQSGAIKLWLQLPARPVSILFSKLLALAAAWLLAVAIPVSAAVIWRGESGHVAGLELLGLVAGHTLYAAVVACLSLAVVAWAGSASVASLLVLAATLGSWTLDFSGAGQARGLGRMASLSLTGILRPWEDGIFWARNLGVCVVVCSGLIAFADAGLWPGRRLRQRLGQAMVTALVSLPLAALAAQLRFSRDLTENRKNSFAPEEEAALSRLDQEIRIDVHLSPEDPRYHDFERSVLSKLRRVAPRIRMRLFATSAGTFGPGEDERYGEIRYHYAGRMDMSRSTSPREVLPILWALSGTEPPLPRPSDYSGYPLVAPGRVAGPWFFGLLPTIIALGASWRHWPRRLFLKEKQ
jgi:ABC-2 type transport system permease protein